MFYISLNLMSLTYVKTTLSILNDLSKKFFFRHAYMDFHIKWNIIVKHQYIWVAKRSLWKFTFCKSPNDFRCVCHSEKQSLCHYLVLENEYLANMSNHTWILKFCKQIVFKPLLLFYVFKLPHSHPHPLWCVMKYRFYRARSHVETS